MADKPRSTQDDYIPLFTEGYVRKGGRNPPPPQDFVRPPPPPAFRPAPPPSPAPQRPKRER